MLQTLRTKLSTIREILSLVWSQATPFVKLRLLLALLLLIVMSLTTALGPLALSHVVDSLSGRRTVSPLPVTLLALLYVTSQWFARSLGELRGLVYARAERRMFRSLSERLFSHVMRLPLRFHLERQTGAINQALENGLQGYQMIVHHLVFTFLPLIVELGATSVVLMGLKQPVFFWLFSGALGCYVVAFAIAAFRVADAASSASKAHVSAAASMTDGVINYETVKLFAGEAAVQERVSQAFIRTEHEWVSFYRQYAMNGLVIAGIFGTFLLTTTLYAIHQVQVDRLTLGEFVLVNTYMLQMVRPVEMLGYAMQAFSQGIAMLEKLLEIFHQEAEPGNSAVTSSLTSSLPPDKQMPATLEFQNVSLFYHSDRAVLKGLSFVVPAGSTLGIVGSSGGGKSTIVRLSVRMLEPNGGCILLDGRPITEISLDALRGAIAVVPQDTVLFDDTIAFNIGFGKAGSIRADIERAAKLANLHERILRMPEGYETRVGERGVKLSGGERQRVSIARATLKNPRMFIYDEATSSLDSRTEQEILKNLRDVSQSSTTLVIAHRLSTVAHADEIVVLEEGSIVERGSHLALLRKEGRYAALWRAQQESTVHNDPTTAGVARASR